MDGNEKGRRTDSVVRLVNIQMNEEEAECDIFPEGSSQAGHIIIDAMSGALLSAVLPKGYEWCRSHVGHAKRRLFDIIKQGPIELGRSVTVAWY